MVKWLIVPAVLACLGWYVIGPRLAVKVGSGNAASQTKTPPSDQTPLPADAGASAAKAGATALTATAMHTPSLGQPTASSSKPARTSSAAGVATADGGPEVTMTSGPADKTRSKDTSTKTRSTRTTRRRHPESQKPVITIVDSPKDSGSVGGLEGPGTPSSSHKHSSQHGPSDSDGSNPND